MFKKFTVLFAVLAAVSSTFAQEQSSGTKFGLRAGLNLGKISYSQDGSDSYSGGSYDYVSSRSSDLTYNTGNLIGFHVGAVADIKILEFLFFQPGLLFSLKGGEMESKSESYYYYNDGSIEVYGSSDKMTISAYYIDVPLMLSLKGTLTNDLALRAHVGPYIGIGLFGKYKEEYSDLDSDYSDSYKYEVENIFSPSKECYEDYGEEYCYEEFGFNRFNAGIAFGVGIEFQDLYLGVNYNYGLTNLYSGEGAKLYERTLGITLGYNF